MHQTIVCLLLECFSVFFSSGYSEHTLKQNILSSNALVKKEISRYKH